MKQATLFTGALLLGVLATASGCRGLLVLNENGFVGQPCIESTDCGVTGICLGGTCQAQVSGTWCDCEPNQGCLSGECVTVTADNGCSPDNSDGACVGGAVCVDGSCVPITASNACSALNPEGLCESGASCVNGKCVATSSYPCSPDHLDGLCDAGYACTAPGVCTVVLCSTEHPTGACEVDEVCNAGTCEALPCGPLHLHGACDDGYTCSSTGTCIGIGTCVVPEDCGDFFDCSQGICVRDYSCVDNADCPTIEHCVTGGTCLPDGVCVFGGDASDCASTEKCASTGICIDATTCLSDADCATGSFCSNTNPRSCLTDGQCASNSDCPPGHTCNAPTCEVSGTLCNTNDFTTLNCPVDPPGVSCCDVGQRCSAAGSCIYQGSCVDNSDCLAGYFTCSSSYTCAPVTACSSDANCAPGDKCSFATGGCIPDTTSPATCAVDLDCPVGEFCNGNFLCEVDTSCGADKPVAATKVEPNMLILLDRSGSMSTSFTYNSTCTTRWLTAVGAISSVMAQYETDIHFGLATYPEMNPGNWVNTNFCGDCADTGCNNSCGSRSVPGPLCCGGDGTGNNMCPGEMDGEGDVAVGAGTRTAIDTLLDINAGTMYPGGYTPTGPTLRNIETNPGAFGLPVASDPVARNNYILLVTDGDANSDSSDDPLCTYDNSAATRVNCALDRLQLLNPTIKTFVVGLAFGSVSANLNCHAVHGGTARQDTCAGVTADTCASATNYCYFPAENEADLLSAFQNIAGQIASCQYTLAEAPPAANYLYVYLDYGSGTVVRINPGPDGWSYDGTSNQVTMLGTSCDAIKAGTATPQIVIACSGTGG